MLRSGLSLLTLLALATAATSAADRARETPAPEPTTAPFEATSHRNFDDVAFWTSVFDDPKRDDWQKPAELVARLHLSPGATVADLGAGTGYLTRYLSKAVGPTGTVLAIDTEPNLIAHLRTRAEREGGVNVVPILASSDNPRLPQGRIDLVLIVDTFHHIDARLGYFRRLQRFLSPGGRVAIVDWLKRDIPVGPKHDHKLPRGQVVAEMQAAGYRLIDEPDLLPYQYFLVFAPSPR